MADGNKDNHDDDDGSPKSKGEQISSKSVSNRVNFFEKSLQVVQSKMAKSPPRMGKAPTLKKSNEDASVDTVSIVSMLSSVATSQISSATIPTVKDSIDNDNSSLSRTPAGTNNNKGEKGKIKAPSSKPQEEDKEVPTESTTAQKWKARVTANKKKKKLAASGSSTTNAETPTDSAVDNNNDDNNNDNNQAPEFEEDDEIVDSAMDNDNDNNRTLVEEQAAVAAVQAHTAELRSTTSPAKDKDEPEPKKEKDDDEAIGAVPEQLAGRNFLDDEDDTRKDIALGFGPAPEIYDDDDEDEDGEGLLMYSMDRLKDDVALEDLFSTAASLNIRLETEAAANARPQRLYSKPQNIYGKQGTEDAEEQQGGDGVESSSDESDSDSDGRAESNNESDSDVDVESNDQIDSDSDESPEFHEEIDSDTDEGPEFHEEIDSDTDEGPEFHEEIDSDTDESPEGEKSAQAVRSTTSAAARFLLYDSDDEDEADIENGLAVPGSAFRAMPYSTGKWKKNEEGMSVISDDISISSGVGILGTRQMLSYTILNSNPKQVPRKLHTKRKYKCSIMLLCLLLIGIIGTLIWLLGFSSYYTTPLPLATSAPSPTVPTAPLNMLPTIGADNSGQGTISPITEAPTSEKEIIAPITEAPTSEKEIIAPVTQTPFLVPDESKLPPALNKFQNTAALVGQEYGNRFGSVISMSSGGNFLAALSNSPDVPVQTFQRQEMSDSWVPILAMPADGATIWTDTSLAFGSDIACATILEEGPPVVAISSRTQVGVYQLVGGAWVNRGQPMTWDAGTVSYSAMALSSDASTLATCYVDESSDDMSVQIYRYDPLLEIWNSLEVNPLVYNAQSRGIGFSQEPLLSVSLALSGDGNVLSVKEWAMTGPQIIVQNFEFEVDSGSWVEMGGQLVIPFGPASIALAHDGHTVAVVANHPGQALVWQWNDGNWDMISGNAIHGFLPGGTSVALARNGSRILIGDSSMDKALVYDYGDNNAWLPTTQLWGPDSSGFGTSVVIDETGNTLGIGSPTSNLMENNLGQVLMYG